MDDWVSKAIVKTMTDGRCHCQQWRKNSKHKPCVSNTEVSEGDLLKWILCWVSLVVQVISLTRNVCTTAWDIYQAWQHYKRQIHTFPAWERNTHCRARLTKKKKKIGRDDGTSQKTSFGVRPRASLWQQQKSSEEGGGGRDSQTGSEENIPGWRRWNLRGGRRFSSNREVRRRL